MLSKKKIEENLAGLSITPPKIFFYDETDSTNTRAIEYAKSLQEKEAAVFIANCQSAGRGRRGRSFVSNRGAGIYISFLTFPKESGERATHATAGAAVCVARAVEALCSCKVQIKWVNDLYLGAKKLGLLVSVNTNGLLITDERVKFFADNPPQKLNISLYGASAETYRGLCGNGDAFEKTLSAIKKLKQAGVSVKINFTATQYNRHDAAKIYEISDELGIPVQAVSYMFPPVRVGGNADRLPPDEAAKVQFECLRLSMGCEKLKNHIDRRISTPRANDNGGLSDSLGERIPCRAGLSTFWVTWDGKMSPCGMMSEPSFAIESFDKAWSSVKKSRESIMLPPKCRSCELRNFCDMCAAVAQAETGDFSGVPEYICQKAAEFRKLCENFNTG